MCKPNVIRSRRSLYEFNQCLTHPQHIQCRAAVFVEIIFHIRVSSPKSQLYKPCNCISWIGTQRFLHFTKVPLNHSSSLSILHKIATITELHHSLASLQNKNNMLGANHFYPIQRTENLFPTNPYIPASYLVDFISRLCIASLLLNSHTFRWLYVFRVLDNYSHIPLPHFPNSNPFPPSIHTSS